MLKFGATPAAEITVCSVVKGELFYGARRSQYPEQNVAKQREFLKNYTSLPFDDTCFEYYGRIRAELATSGTPIGPNDLFIAAIALTNSLILVTHNTREFNRIVNLQIEDWELI